MDRIQFDANVPNLVLLRQAIFRRLRAQEDWHQLDVDVREGYQHYVELTPPRANDVRVLELSVLEVFWQLVGEGIIAPGWSANQGSFPWFRITQYGQRALAEHDYMPHDRTGYLALLNQRISKPDATVVAYLAESLDTFVRGNLVASAIVLGVAAERVFLLLCDSLYASLHSAKEKTKLGDMLKRRSIKGPVDWVHDKLRSIQQVKPQNFPENAALMVTAIYDLIRFQRNELGHPREKPPRITQGEAHANLLIFPRYYETAEAVRAFLSVNKV
jgi:hypothetical protein